MNLKIKILIGALVVGIILISGWWIWNGQTIKNPRGICGPKGMGINYDVLYCDETCNVDDDCKFTCGCGAINKNEICHDEGITYDCVDHEVKCKEGRCIIGKEILLKGVTLTTDKTEYEQGEKINIIVKNNMHDKIFHCGAGDLSGWRWNLKKKENGIWKEIDGRELFPTVWTPPLRELAPNETFSVTVKKEVIEKTISPGTYKIGFKFFLTLDQTLEDVRENCWEREPNIIYSNEFTIK